MVEDTVADPLLHIAVPANFFCEFTNTHALWRTKSRISNQVTIRPIPSPIMTIPSTNGITADVSTGVKKQYTPAMIISMPKLTDKAFLVIIISISLIEKRPAFGGALEQ